MGFYGIEATKQEHDQQRQAAHLADTRAKAAAVSTFSLNPDETDRLTHVSKNPRQIDRAALKSLAAVLHESRRLEDAMGAAPLLPAARAQLTLFEHFVTEARGGAGPAPSARGAVGKSVRAIRGLAAQ